MKKTFFFIVLMSFYTFLSCNNKTENMDDSKIVTNKNISVKSNLLNRDNLGQKWLVEFYINYITLYINSPNRKNKSKLNLFFNQLDSIKKENCTNAFYKLQNEDEFVKEFDYITNNEFICEQSLKSLEVNPKHQNKNIYIVSFVAEYPLNELKSGYKKINFEVTIAKENGVYKITKTCCF